MTRMQLTTLTALGLLLAAPLPATADVDAEASAEEAAKVREAIGKIGCEAEEIEKESDDLFEIDDAVCEIGQYDIKLNGAFTIVSMTFDGPIDDDGEEVEASAEEAEEVAEALEAVNCEADEIEKESDTLYELDDAVCEAGQYDIKLDGAFTIVSMTFDGPIDEEAAEVSPEAVERINAMLAEMQCEMDEDDIEAEAGGGYELDDVFCADGQYDIELDADFAVVNKRKE